MIKETYPSGRVVRNEFESDGDISSIYGKANPTATEHTYASSFSYTPDGKIAKLRLGNGLWEAARFNTRLQKSGVIYEATVLKVKLFGSWKATVCCYESLHLR